MSRAPAFTTAAAALFPAVTHIDGTARVQTVEQEQHPWIFALLARVKELIGFGILGNTSLNVKGRPILNWASDAISMLQTETEIYALMLEDFFLLKHNCATQT